MKSICVFVVGGADGLPPDWRPRAHTLLSLSRMTLPHELARALRLRSNFTGVRYRQGTSLPR